MDIDKSSEQIILSEDEARAIGMPNNLDWPLSSADRLLRIVQTQRNRVDDIDTSRSPFMAERARLLAEKQKDGRLLGLMLDQLSPHVSEHLADEVEEFLREQS